MQQVEQLAGRLAITPDGVAGLLRVDRGTAKDREPNDGHNSWDHQDHAHELANRTSAGNAGNEHADERRPGDPPCPVENGPGTQPLIRTIARVSGTGSHLEELGQVVTQGGRYKVQNHHGWPDDQDEQSDETGQNHIGVGQVLNALAHTGSGGSQEAKTQDHDGADNHPSTGVGNQARGIQAGLNLHGTQAQRSCGTENRREDGGNVDDLAQRALGALLPDQRNKRRGQKLLAPHTEGAICNGQRHDGVQRPRVQAPVEQRGGKGAGHIVLLRPRHAVAVVRQRLGHTVEHQANTHARGEHHGHPGDAVELRRLVILAQANVPELTERNEQNEPDKHRAGEDVQPAPVTYDIAQRSRGEGGEAIATKYAPQHDSQDEGCRTARDYPVDGLFLISLSRCYFFS